MKELTLEDLDTVLGAADPLWGLAEPDAPDMTFAMRKQIHSALKTMERTEFFVVFDWQAEFKDRKHDLRSLAVLETVDLAELRRIMTAHVRMDRFVEGHLDKLFSSGYWIKALFRLGQLRDEMAARS